MAPALRPAPPRQRPRVLSPAPSRRGKSGFRPARMALVKLCLLRKGVSVSEKLNPMESNPPTSAASCSTSSTRSSARPSGGSRPPSSTGSTEASAPPRSTALGELFAKAQHHSGRLRSENERHAAALEKRLRHDESRLKDVPEGPAQLRRSGPVRPRLLPRQGRSHRAMGQGQAGGAEAEARRRPRRHRRNENTDGPTVRTSNPILPEEL